MILIIIIMTILIVILTIVIIIIVIIIIIIIDLIVLLTDTNDGPSLERNTGLKTTLSFFNWFNQY